MAPKCDTGRRPKATKAVYYMGIFRDMDESESATPYIDVFLSPVVSV